MRTAIKGPGSEAAAFLKRLTIRFSPSVVFLSVLLLRTTWELLIFLPYSFKHLLT